MITQKLLQIALVPAIVGFTLPTATPQSKRDKIARAMEAAPPSITDKATIMDSDGTVLRPGSNSWRCLPTSGPGTHYPMCNDEVWTRLMNAIANKAAFHTDRIGISYMLAGDDKVSNTDPYDTHEDPGETWVQDGPHLMIVVPDAKALEGIPSDPSSGGPYVMWRGTPYVHIMVPIGPPQKTNRRSEKASSGDAPASAAIHRINDDAAVNVR